MNDKQILGMPGHAGERALSLVLRLQFLYAALLLAWNLCNIWAVWQGQVALSPAPLKASLPFFTLYLFVTCLGSRGWPKLYRAAMAIFVLLLSYGGVLVHVLHGYDPQQYHSVVTFILAIAINIFGTVVSVLGAWKGPGR
jgi:hypothetical protein